MAPTPQEIQNARDNPLFTDFHEWGKENGIGTSPLDYEEDWYDWWVCFLAGAVAQWKQRVNLPTSNVNPEDRRVV